MITIKKSLMALAMAFAVCPLAMAHQPQSMTVTTANPFSTIYIQYNPTSQRYSHNDVTDTENYSAFSLGWSYTFPVYQDLMVEAGIAGQYFYDSEENSRLSQKTSMWMLSGKVPVNLVYDFRIPNSSVAIDPYAGLFARFNIAGKIKMENEYGEVTNDIFDEDEMGDYALKRFQFGFQAGVNVRINDVFLVGGGYWMDFNEISEHNKFRGWNITLGMTF